MNVVDRAVLALAQFVWDAIQSWRQRNVLKGEAEAAAKKAAAGDPSDAERFIREHGGPR